MNLDELRSIRDDERSSGSLQPLRPSFYREARTFIESLKTERDSKAAASDEPFADPEVAQLTDRLESASEVLESIYENRLGKLLTHASTTALGDGDEPPALTEEEGELFDLLVTSIRSNRQAAIRGASAGSADDEATSPTPPVQSADAEPIDADEDGPTEATDETPDDIERIIVRVTADVGTILGTDEREYDLQRGDVVSLPVENAQALIEREAVVHLEPDEAV